MAPLLPPPALSHLDTDAFFWAPTDPPFARSRPMPERLARLEAALDAAPSGWALSGSLCGWGDPLIARFDLVIFLRTATELRLRRLRARERAAFGAATLAPGGFMHANHEAFLAWAARYDAGDPVERSLALHERWLARLPCPVLRLDGALPIATLTSAVLAHLWAARPARPDATPRCI